MHDPRRPQLSTSCLTEEISKPLCKVTTFLLYFKSGIVSRLSHLSICADHSPPEDV